MTIINNMNSREWQERIIEGVVTEICKLDPRIEKDALEAFALTERIKQLEKDNKVLIDFMNYHNKDTYPQGQYKSKKGLCFEEAESIAKKQLSAEYKVPFDRIIVSKTILCKGYYMVEAHWYFKSNVTVKVEIESKKATILLLKRACR